MSSLLILLLGSAAVVHGAIEYNRRTLVPSFNETSWSVITSSSFTWRLIVDDSMGERPRLQLHPRGETFSQAKVFLSIEVYTRGNKIFITLPIKSTAIRLLTLRAPLNNGGVHAVTLRINGTNVKVTDNCRVLYDHPMDDLELDLNGTSYHETVPELYFQDRGSVVCENMCGHSLESLEDNQLLKGCAEEIILDSVEAREEHRQLPDGGVVTPRVPSKTPLPVSRSPLAHQTQSMRTGTTTMELFQQHVCKFHDNYLSLGEKHVDAAKCEECTCAAGAHMVCGPIGCPAPSCSHPVTPPGECCPVCRKECSYGEQRVEHGGTLAPRPCHTCVCNDGELSCEYQHPSFCPPLNCTEQTTSENQCCPVCNNRDYCAEHNPCGEYATCVNRDHKADCQCPLGFIGNGTHCFDMDECLWSRDAREQLGGCLDGSICVNLPGTFRCDCLPGYTRYNEQACLNLVRF